MDWKNLTIQGVQYGWIKFLISSVLVLERTRVQVRSSFSSKCSKLGYIPKFGSMKLGLFCKKNVVGEVRRSVGQVRPVQS